MIDETGARLQENMRQAPAAARALEFPFPLRGVIDKVFFMDDGANVTLQTVVDVNLHGGYNKLLKVPLCTTKVNKDHGYEWTPEPGDGVIVQFINGHWDDPIVTGYFPLQKNNIQAKTVDAPEGKRRYHARCNKTDVVIDKDGNRITLINGDESMTVAQSETNDGNWTVKIEGFAKINVTGDAEVTAKGDISARAGANAEVRSKGWAQVVGDGEVMVKSNTRLTLKGPRGVIIL